jgi:cytochrome c1
VKKMHLGKTMLMAAATVLAASPALAAAGKADRHRVETEVKSSLTASVNKAAGGVVAGVSNTTLIAGAAGVAAVAVTVVVASDSSPATTG